MTKKITTLVDPGKHYLSAFDAQVGLLKDRVVSSVVDVGAASGNVAATYAGLFPEATVYAVEPFGAAFRQLKARFEENPRVRPRKLALWDRIGEVSLCINAYSETNSLLETDARAGLTWGSGLLDTERREPVAATTLDAFCEEEGLEHLDVLKLDVQGGEHRVLAGASRMLRQQKVSLVYLEIITGPTYQGQRPLWEYLRLFDEYDYRLVDFFNAQRREGALIQVDALFTAPQLLHWLPE